MPKAQYPIYSKNPIKRNLHSVDVFITDTAPDSKYFKILESPSRIPIGKSSILIDGSQFLKKESTVIVELLDANGVPIFTSPVPDILEGTSRRITIETTHQTAHGPAILTVLGELDPTKTESFIPLKYRGHYNVKWQKTFDINLRSFNNEPILFYNQDAWGPQIKITEKILPHMEPSASIHNTKVITSVGKISGNRIPKNVRQPKTVPVTVTAQIDLVEDVGSTFQNTSNPENKSRGRIYNRYFPVYFTSNESRGDIAKYFWTFDDEESDDLDSNGVLNPIINNGTGKYSYGNSSTLSEVIHVFRRAGAYNVTLTVIGKGGDISVDRYVIDVDPPLEPIAFYTLTPLNPVLAGDATAIVTFTISHATVNPATGLNMDNSTDKGFGVDTEYELYFGDGTLDPTGEGQVSHYYISEDTFQPGLKVYNAYREQWDIYGFDHSAADPVVVTKKPIAAFNADDYTINANASVAFTNISATTAAATWSWWTVPSAGASFVSGSSSTSEDPHIRFDTDNTNYSVFLKATETTGENDTTSRVIKVGSGDTGTRSCWFGFTPAQGGATPLAVTFSGSAVDVGNVDEWKYEVVNQKTTPPEDDYTIVNGSLSSQTVKINFTGPDNWHLRLKAHYSDTGAWTNWFNGSTFSTTSNPPTIASFTRTGTLKVGEPQTYSVNYVLDGAATSARAVFYFNTEVNWWNNGVKHSVTKITKSPASDPQSIIVFPKSTGTLSCYVSVYDNLGGGVTSSTNSQTILNPTAPVANIKWKGMRNTIYGTVPFWMDFDGEGSTGYNITYNWEAKNLSDPNGSWKYISIARIAELIVRLSDLHRGRTSVFNIRLTVTDAVGQTDTATGPPVIKISQGRGGIIDTGAGLLTDISTTNQDNPVINFEGPDNVVASVRSAPPRSYELIPSGSALKQVIFDNIDYLTGATIEIPDPIPVGDKELDSGEQKYVPVNTPLIFNIERVSADPFYIDADNKLLVLNNEENLTEYWDFEPSEYTMSYFAPIELDWEIRSQQSYASVRIDNMRTFSGEVRKVRLLYRDRNIVNGDFKVLGEKNVKSNDHLSVPFTIETKQYWGTFISQGELDKRWFALQGTKAGLYNGTSYGSHVNLLGNYASASVAITEMDSGSRFYIDTGTARTYKYFVSNSVDYPDQQLYYFNADGVLANAVENLKEQINNSDISGSVTASRSSTTLILTGVDENHNGQGWAIVSGSTVTRFDGGTGLTGSAEYVTDITDYPTYVKISGSNYDVDDVVAFSHSGSFQNLSSEVGGYQLKFRAIGIKAAKEERDSQYQIKEVRTARLEVYITGSCLNKNYMDDVDYGKFLGYIDVLDNNLYNFDLVETDFDVDNTDGNGILQFVAKSGLWYIKDISLTQEAYTGISPDFYKFEIPIPSYIGNNRTYDFKVEYLNDKSDIANQKSWTRAANAVTFEGSSTLIAGDNNLVNGTLYIGERVLNSQGQFEFRGIEAHGGSAYLRNVGYRGYKSASMDNTFLHPDRGKAGFMFWSGSILTDNTDEYDDGDVGFELHGGPGVKDGTAGAMRFRSSLGGKLEVTGSIEAQEGHFSNTFSVGTGSAAIIISASTHMIHSGNWNGTGSNDGWAISGSGQAWFREGYIADWELRKVDSGSATERSVISGSNMVLDSAGNIKTTNYITNVRGWNIDQFGFAEFENAKIRGELYTTVFEKETINAVGGQLIIANATVLSGSGAILQTAETMSVTNVSGFAQNEIIAAKKVSGSGITTEYMLVDSSSRYNPASSVDFGGQLYVSRAYQSGSIGNSGSLFGQAHQSQSYEPGQVLVSSGLVGTGYIKVNANPNDSSTPYIDIIERTGSGIYDVELKARLGDLSGIASLSSPGFGLWSENVFLTGEISANTGSIGGFTVTNDALSGANFYLSGSATGNNYFISSSNFNVKASGDITGSSVLFIGGKVGGFTLAATTMTATNLLIDAGNQKLVLGTGTDVITLDAADATYRLAIGHSTYANAPFRVTKAGALTSVSANLGGWTVDSN